MSSHRPVRTPVSPSPHQAQGELPSDEYSDFPPIREHKSTSESPHQAQGELPSDEYSDFPPIREHKSTAESNALRPHSPTNRFRLRSLMVRKGPEKYSSPTESEPLPFQLPRYYRQRNKGLKHKDILNTIEVPMKYPENDDHKSTSTSKRGSESQVYDSASRPLKKVLPMKYPKNDNHKSTLKRGSESCAAYDSRPLKKYYRLNSVYKDDVDWIRDEIVDIKKCTREMACRMEKVLERLP